MRITLDRSICDHHPAACEQCFGEYLKQWTIQSRPCITRTDDDGRPELTVHIHYGPYHWTLVVTDENREAIIYDGFMKYANLPRAGTNGAS